MLADCSLSPLCLHALIIEDWSRDVRRGAWPATVRGLNVASMDRPGVRVVSNVIGVSGEESMDLPENAPSVTDLPRPVCPWFPQRTCRWKAHRTIFSNAEFDPTERAAVLYP
jgi:hypothetical protein